MDTTAARLVRLPANHQDVTVLAPVATAELDPQTWATRHFGDLDLGDVRRNRRAITIAAACAAHPGESLPELFPRWTETKAAYDFYNNPAVTPDDLQETHRELTMEQIRQPGLWLLPEDTSEISWAGGKPRQNLGPVGGSKEGEQGFLLHTTLALRWLDESLMQKGDRHPPVEVIGIADQQAVVRVAAPPGETRRERLLRERESDLWETQTRRLGTAPAEAAVRWVRVCDRGADIYEFLASCAEEDHGYVVRAAQDRALVTEEGKDAGNLFATALALPAFGCFTLDLRARPGQAARTARLSLSAAPVRLRAPARPGFGVGSLPPVCCTVVCVREIDPPAGVVPLLWILLSDAPATNFLEAREITLQYATRWIVEDFHKGIKTGMGVERLQLEDGKALMKATALLSVVALRLLHLREMARIEPDAPVEASGLDTLELAVLEEKGGRQLLTLRDVVLSLGRLGGHLNRKSDGMPGWITLWRGYLKLRDLVEGVRLAHKLKRFR